MQVPIDQISFEQQIKELSRVFADCAREEFEGVLPNATITLYVKQPKSYGEGQGESGFQFSISDESVSGETLEYHMNSHGEPLIQKFLDRVSSNYRESGRYQSLDRSIKFLGRVLEIKGSLTASTEYINLDESDFSEIAKFALEKNWIYKIEIDRDLVIKIIKLAQPYLSKLLAEHGADFIEFIKDSLSD